MTNSRDHQNLLKLTIIRTQEIYHDILFIPQTTGTYKTDFGYIKSGYPGLADLLFIYPFKGEALTGFAEIKTGNATLQKNQKNFRDKVLSLKALYILVRHEDDIIRILREKYANVQSH